MAGTLRQGTDFYGDKKHPEILPMSVPEITLKTSQGFLFRNRNTMKLLKRSAKILYNFITLLSKSFKNFFRGIYPKLSLLLILTFFQKFFQ